MKIRLNTFLKLVLLIASHGETATVTILKADLFQQLSTKQKENFIARLLQAQKINAEQKNLPFREGHHNSSCTKHNLCPGCNECHFACHCTNPCTSKINTTALLETEERILRKEREILLIEIELLGNNQELLYREHDFIEQEQALLNIELNIIDGEREDCNSEHSIKDERIRLEKEKTMIQEEYDILEQERRLLCSLLL